MTQQEEITGRAAVEGVEAAREMHIAALNDGDADAWVAAFADDGVMMPPNGPAFVGRERILEWAQGFLGAFHVRFGLAVDEVQPAGDWAFERGTYTIDMTPRTGGGPVQEIGKYLTIYQRQSTGAWRLARDIWNSNSPLPTGR